jgi:hypothetical protein
MCGVYKMEVELIFFLNQNSSAHFSTVESRSHSHVQEFADEELEGNKVCLRQHDNNNHPIKDSSKTVCFDLKLENQNLGSFSGEVEREDCFVLKN